MHKPNFFIVGVPRAGTTSFYNYLKEHSEVFMSPVKGPNFFGEVQNENFPEYHKNEKKYLQLFKDAKNEKIFGEASHLFCSKTAPIEIKKFNPHSKILIILRDPKYVFLSRFNSSRLEGEDIADILKNKNKKNKEMWDNFKYSENIQRYLKIFGKKVYIMIFEEFVNNPKKEWENLCIFLKIKKDLIPEFKKYNPSRERKNKWILTGILKIPGKYRLSLKKIAPRKLFILLKRIIKKKTTKREINLKEENNNLLIRLDKEFENEVKKTSKIIDRDLTKIWI